jgi:hypothetical protein
MLETSKSQIQEGLARTEQGGKGWGERVNFSLAVECLPTFSLA